MYIRKFRIGTVFVLFTISPLYYMENSVRYLNGTENFNIGKVKKNKEQSHFKMLQRITESVGKAHLLMECVTKKLLRASISIGRSLYIFL